MVMLFWHILSAPVSANEVMITLLLARPYVKIVLVWHVSADRSGRDAPGFLSPGVLRV